MQTSTALGFPAPNPAVFRRPLRPPAAPPPRYYAPQPIRIANRASTRPIIGPPAYQPYARPGFMSRERQYAFEAETAARAAANAQMIAQQYALQAQQNAMLPPQQVQSSPAAPGGDLTTAQDNSAAADAASVASDPAASGHKHLLLFAGIAVAAGVGGYILIKKKKARG